MTAVDYILEGLAKALEVERELGVRTVELDRSLLEVPAAALPAAERTAAEQTSRSTPITSERPVPVPRPAPEESVGPAHPFVFLHHAPLKPEGIEMMAKIVIAMKRTADEAPVVFTGALPKAGIYVVLGQKALEQWFPGETGAVGQWIKGPKGEEILVTYSPEQILRFGTVTPAVQQMKRSMWTSLKGVMQRIG